MTTPTPAGRVRLPAHRWDWARERWLKGDLIATIARRLGVTPQAVQLYASRHGWPKRYKVDRGQQHPRRWRCDAHGRLCTPAERCGCVQAWEGAA